MRLAPIMQAFFTDHLIAQRHASQHTMASYRDYLRLLLGFAHQRTGKLPAQLDLADLDAALIGAFLTDLEPPAATAPPPATPGSPRSARCSATRRCRPPSTPSTKLESRQFRGHFHYAAFGAQLSNWRS